VLLRAELVTFTISVCLTVYSRRTFASVLCSLDHSMAALGKKAMPQVHFVASRELALKTARDKILQAPDDASTIVSGRLVIEALLHAFVRSRLPPGH
jgi:hypothetical protein